MSTDSAASADHKEVRPVILVTGGSGAIGGEIAARAAASGAAVAVHASTRASAGAAVERIRARVPEAEIAAYDCDFREPGSTRGLVQSVATAMGRIDSVIHCAITGAPGVTGLFRDTDPDSYGRHAALVLGSFQALCFHALPHLAQHGGAIVVFASDAGRFAAPRQSLIGGANGGLITFVRNLAPEIARDGVRINCISPSFVEKTPAFDRYAAGGRGESARRRAGLGLPTPGDIAPLALFLSGAGAAKITGQVISVNGGLNA